MFILSILPESFIHAIFCIGALTVCLSYIMDVLPGISRYKIPVQVVGIIVLVFGTYLEGALSNEREWQLKALELQTQNAKVETVIAKADVQIVEKIVTKTKIVREKADEVVKFVDREVVKYDTKFIKGGECEIPTGFYEAYNKSLETPK